MIYKSTSSRGRHRVRPSHGLSRYLQSLGRDILNGMVAGLWRVVDS